MLLISKVKMHDYDALSSTVFHAEPISNKGTSSRFVRIRACKRRALEMAVRDIMTNKDLKSLLELTGAPIAKSIRDIFPSTPSV